MERVLRYIGPISVTLRAYDQAFLSYSGGIFMSTEDSQCNDLVADHAMIIVGYGEEVSRNGTKLKVSNTERNICICLFLRHRPTLS